MSVLQSKAMFNDQINSFNPGHIRSRSYNELLNQFKTAITSKNNPVAPPMSTGGLGTFKSLSASKSYVKKRSYSDLIKDSSNQLYDDIATKRSRTAPPSPPLEPAAHHGKFFDKHLSPPANRARSLSPNKKFCNPISPSNSPNTSPVLDSAKSASHNVTLPSISAALNSAELPSSRSPIKLKPITPTVSLDYFDTYKPNDENWRYELLDTINKSSKHFNINQYNYLNKHASSSPRHHHHHPQKTSEESNDSLNKPPSAYKPSFDSRISSKIKNPIIKPTLIPKMQHYSERKINFPYESNYTYLNKTYLHDVEKYPEYLELAQSLVQFSQSKPPHQQQPQQPYLQQVPLPVQTAYNPYSPQQQYTSVQAAYSTTSQQPVAMPFVHNQSAYPTPVTNYYNHQPSNIPNSSSTHNVTSPSASRLPEIKENSHSYTIISGASPSTPSKEKPNQSNNSHAHTKFIPVTPPSSKTKSRTELLKSPPKSHSAHHHNIRVCISCGSDQSPCWRPSWSIKEGQLCNSCGLRYKKTSARCLNKSCKKIPAKGEWSLMQSKGKVEFEDGHEGYSCLDCGWKVEVKK